VFSQISHLSSDLKYGAHYSNFSSWLIKIHRLFLLHYALNILLSYNKVLSVAFYRLLNNELPEVEVQSQQEACDVPADTLLLADSKSS